MPAPEDTTSHAGRQQSPEVDIAALYARLQDEVARSGGGGRDDLAGLRDIAERHWAVSADRALARRPGLRGTLRYSMKRLLRPLLRWYVEPLVDEQRMFNHAVLQLVDALLERDARDRTRA